ncbi:M23 family metallopeptidase [Bacillus massiliglaciei]|uniref:M23 family metallopeptidase n=1 Tax=Bacillus massiliglaciei TaxID=1816693 RepID=UPI000AC4E489|nr:M23 family metallopeptidase [Bacillus massiliglaciei]
MREEERKTTSKIQRILKKRWALPAIYLASAAIILAAAFLVQMSFRDSADQGNKEYTENKGFDEPSVEVNSNLENVKMPVADSSETVIKKQFYDVNADEKEQEAALVFYNNRYEPNKGIDIAQKDGKEFEVKASLSGTVKTVQEDALLGNLIEVEHEDGVMTRYQSIQDIKVAVGDRVKQGQAIAMSGTSQINEEAENHVHFEIRKENIAVNPIEFDGKQASTIDIAKEEQAPKAAEEETSDEADTKGDAGKSDPNADEETPDSQDDQTQPAEDEE